MAKNANSTESDLPVTSAPLLGVRLAEIHRTIREMNDPVRSGEKTGHRVALHPQGSTRQYSVPIGIRHYLPEHEGQGFWEHIRIRKGLFLSITDAEYKRPVSLTLPAEPLLKIRILLSGTMQSHNDDFLSKGGESHIQAISGNSPVGYTIDPEGGPLRVAIIHCRAEAFDKMWLDPAGLGEPFKTIVETGTIPDMAYALNRRVSIKNMGKDILDSKDNFLVDTRRLFLAAKSEEILNWVIESTRPRRHIEIGANKVSDRELTRLNEVKNIIEANLASPPTIKELSRLVGMNSTKLKLGYRELFGETIGSNLNRLRLDKALALVESSDLSFAEIGYKVGYNYPANFTQAFKKRYGMTPREARTAIKRHI